VEREELAIVPCQGEGPYASCPKIRRVVDAGQKIPALEGDVATLSIEVEVQRNSLVQITNPSSELTRTLEGCERQRRVVDEERQRHEEMRAVEARREERLKAAFDPTVAEALRHDSSGDRVFEKLQDSSGGSAQTALVMVH
jgi:hypothetical protein